MPRGTDTQLHDIILQTGEIETVAINRNGLHQYWVGDNGPKMASVTAKLGHLDANGFSVGMGWALKQAKLAGGDLDAPRRIGKEAKSLAPISTREWNGT